MILICEPTCRNFSHEKVNEGFLYLTKTSFPSEKIFFLAHKSHNATLKKALTDKELNTDNITFINININSHNTIMGFIINFFLVIKISKLSKKHNLNRILFLSHPKILIYILCQNILLILLNVTML